ncbi:hypothetical protein DYB37_012963 [Aphanomyces astaci]|uniref:Uncharacterized protein n=2 Tax=Aphanomyces astaci TaxID=112090 RepID=A0A3R7AR13_APHAT|nr:hypothetical protein DYB37_012963 [Aphanomyces astaci]
MCKDIFSTSNYGCLVQTLKLCTQDSNVNMVAKSIEVMGVIMNYPCRKFASYARILLPVLQRKLLGKNSNVLGATH